MGVDFYFCRRCEIILNNCAGGYVNCYTCGDHFCDDDCKEGMVRSGSGDPNDDTETLCETLYFCVKCQQPQDAKLTLQDIWKHYEESQKKLGEVAIPLTEMAETKKRNADPKTASIYSFLKRHKLKIEGDQLVPDTKKRKTNHKE